MSYPNTDVQVTDSLEYIINHVFCPLKLPQEDDESTENNFALSTAVSQSALKFREHLLSEDLSRWDQIAKMLTNISATMNYATLPDDIVVSQLQSMQSGDVCAFLVRAQNAGVIIREFDASTVFETFEVSPTSAAVMAATGKLICNYPGPATSVPHAVSHDTTFQSELANFLACMNKDILDSAATTTKAGSTVVEERDTAHPRYITELLTGILCGLGSPIDVPRIQKRIGDDVQWDDARLPWRRSPLWLVIRVALQTSIERTELYKEFMLFFMVELAKMAADQELSNDILHFMSAKISRRLLKLGSSAPAALTDLVHATTGDIRAKLEDRWSAVKKLQETSPHWAPGTLDFQKDTHLSLSNSRALLSQKLSEKYVAKPPSDFRPNERIRRVAIDDFLANSRSCLKAASIDKAESFVVLADFEVAIARGIDDWVTQVQDVEPACIILEHIISQYSAEALKHYSGNPDNSSIMLLTLMELWVALDKLVVRQIPLLAEYSPEIPSSLLEPILLHQPEHLSRLAQINSYVAGRIARSGEYPSVFSDHLSDISFSIRYFDSSPEQQSLKECIERDAELQREQKSSELDELNEEHDRLSAVAAHLEHSYIINRRGFSVHSYSCYRCSLQKTISGLQISVHEWPLPENPIQAKTVVFELECPLSFDVWRAVTYHMLVDISTPLALSPSEDESGLSSGFLLLLAEYEPLARYMTRFSSRRITLASSTKPWAVVHSGTQSIPNTLDDICVNNGLCFNHYDDIRQAWVSTSLGHTDIAPYCTFTIPPGPYARLQYSLQATIHEPNQVISDQHDCHDDLTLPEFIAFGSLRSGALLQWLNILREVRARTLNFRRIEVYLLILQTIWQVGPLQSGFCPWHEELESATFGEALLSELNAMVGSIEANWLECLSMKTITAVIARLLATTKHEGVRRGSYLLLRRIRKKVFDWLQELTSEKQTADGARSDESSSEVQTGDMAQSDDSSSEVQAADTAQSDDSSSEVQTTDTARSDELRCRVRDTAIACRSTYDQITLFDEQDVEILVYCTIMICDNTPFNTDVLSPESKLALDQDRRLSHSLESLLSDWIAQSSNQEEFNRAIMRIWAAYHPGTSWVAMDGSNARWVTCKTSESTNQQSQDVHYNLLDGRLLIDGKPLSRLPQEIVQHSSYNSLFCGQVLDVFPSDMAGMDFASKNLIDGYQVYFALRDDDDLCIRAKHGETNQILEFIPSQKLTGDFPSLLIEDHVHWLNVDNGELEMRPTGSKWVPSATNWRLYFSVADPSIIRCSESTYMLDIRSDTWKMVSSRLACIERAGYLLVTWDSAKVGPSMVVDLPRLRLCFFLNDEENLQSKNISDMVIDTNQSTGTMFGLVSQLVLRPKTVTAVELQSRAVLIPMGDLNFAVEGHHVQVKVVSSNDSLRGFQLYDIDVDLGYLRGNASLTSKLYKAYLHAATSSCLPDPLTSRTGTEEALDCLWSANCKSFMQLAPADAKLLQRIDALTPKRSFYPSHLKNMQRVQWLCIAPSAQHGLFHDIVKQITGYSKQLRFLQDHSTPSISTCTSDHDEHLLARALSRSLAIYPAEFSGEISTERQDIEYVSRHTIQPAANGPILSASKIAYLARRWSPERAFAPPKLLDKAISWGHLEGMRSISLSYTQEWLNPPPGENWVSWYQACRTSIDIQARYQFAFSLSAMSYSSPDNADLASILLAFATITRFRSESPPLHATYDLNDGFEPSENKLAEVFEDATHSFDHSSESKLSSRPGENSRQAIQRRSSAFRERCDADKNKTVQHLLAQWPSDRPSLPHLSSNHYNTAQLSSDVTAVFASCYHNHCLKEHFQNVQTILDESRYQAINIGTNPSSGSFLATRKALPCVSVVSLGDLFRRPAPHLIVANDHFRLTASTGLQDLVSKFQRSTSALHNLYGESLALSRECLDREGVSATPTTITISLGRLKGYYLQCRKQFRGSFITIAQCLSPLTQAERAMDHSGRWPRISVRLLLGQLASTSDISLTVEWKKVLVTLAKTLLELQRARRLLAHAIKNNAEDFYKEIKNTGCGGWDAETYTDWLLIQIEGNFLIRPVQVDVALQMMHPDSEESTTLQLNMGEGKSSVIVPIAAAALADSQKLVRVVILKSLSAQMFHLLVERLGGLTNRRIFYLPFSRSIPSHQIRHIHQLMEECMDARGILVAQPDHILSYKLMVLHEQIRGPSNIATQALSSQRWLEQHARDILDESDELLHVRYQLIYTAGTQRHLEGHPDRWTTLCQLLVLVSTKALALNLPDGIEVCRDSKESHTFPQMRVYHQDAGVALVRGVSKSIMTGGLPNFSFNHVSPSIRRAILNFISLKDVDDQDSQLVQQFCDGTAWAGVLLLRGILACGILVYVLKERRWRVDYGLDPRRTMLAVPYRAKDTPSPRAEFGHPEIALMLTCLSYYYEGLTEEQLITAFRLLLNQDNPEHEYKNWTRLHSLGSIPKNLLHPSGINLESSQQREEHLIPIFKRNQAVINFFLSQVVFPNEAKEFPLKLVCSGWDLAEQKNNVTTGFSGTNDNRHLLPLSITQHDPEHQLSTNARVLSYLLQPENQCYLRISNSNSERLTAKEFLQVLVEQTPDIQVLLDVGAQMLDLQNKDLAAHWLQLKPHAQAAIYFNEKDELAVISRDGNVELFVSSPFSQQLNRCLLYLDDAHTRGTDVKLPSGFRAAVTLGPKLAKDRLIQGCMRMRKLGKGHSVMFFASTQVDRAIRHSVSKNAQDEIQVSDILHWTMLETCADIQHRASHWAKQGADHHARYKAWSNFNVGADITELKSSWLQEEARSVEEMYAPHSQSRNLALEIPEIRERCRQLGIVSLSDTGMDEEQEREVAHEIEQEHHGERPPQVPPAAHKIHSDVESFIHTGYIPYKSTVFTPIFDTLNRTTAIFAERAPWSPYLLATEDYKQTVQVDGGDDPKVNALDAYIRPMHWVLSSSTSRFLVLISPFEANYFLPELRGGQNVRLHMYTPRVTQQMRPCDDLRLYCIPPLPTEPETPIEPLPDLLRLQLNLFAGQLYFSNREMYIQLCAFLGVYAGTQTLNRESGSEDAGDGDDDVGFEVQCDGFIKPDHRPSYQLQQLQLQNGPAGWLITSSFQNSPLSSVNKLTSIRRKGMSYASTHIGKILHAKVLTARDFEE
ncbi:hypothetical protein BJ138DRAFT_1112671 [Hygrophoropsis aurantiaca]|uniref:Uncharacterized protein n=1 Tax=Hygrophoropsis aurantiaca TaxID=72124 RepID=A0ACB8AFH4_9AGAM|nr:hypothetical protein BJ138DRAFT_1112671 [Hygrophoropsis aurantiaca]